MINYRQILEQKKGQRIQVENQIDLNIEYLRLQKEQQTSLEQAQVVIQEVALLTQDMLRYHISELVTLALAAVFDDPYTFEVDFQQRRNQTECDLWFVRDGERIDPITASGGGAVDVASFALRVSLWSLKKPRSRPILVLDEPFKYVSSNYRQRTSEMLKMISEKLSLQILMVTHSEELVGCANNTITITQKNGVSKVTTL